MPVKNQSAHIRLVEEIVLREINDKDKRAQMVAFVLFCRYRFNWRVNVHSNSALLGIWNELSTLTKVNEETGAESGVTQDVVLNMVNEWMFRVNEIPDYDDIRGLVLNLVDSIFWTAKASALPESVSMMTPDIENVKTILEQNPWVVFLVLVGMSDCIRLILKTDI